MNIPNKTLTTDKGFKLYITFHKPRTERYPEGPCYFATVKKMLTKFNLVFAKGTLCRINHPNFK